MSKRTHQGLKTRVSSFLKYYELHDCSEQLNRPGKVGDSDALKG